MAFRAAAGRHPRGKNGTFSSICDGDPPGGLQKALGTFDAACKTFAPLR